MRPFPHLCAMTLLALALVLPAAVAHGVDPDDIIRNAHADSCRYLPYGPHQLDALGAAPLVGEDLEELEWDLQEPRAFCERNVGNVYIPGEIEIG